LTSLPQRCDDGFRAKPNSFETETEIPDSSGKFLSFPRAILRAAQNGNFIVIRWVKKEKKKKKKKKKKKEEGKKEKKKNNNPPLQRKTVAGDETPEMGRSGGEDFFFLFLSLSVSVSVSVSVSLPFFSLFFFFCKSLH